MKAIVTKFLGPTNHRGSRILVKSDGLKKLTVNWDSSMDVEANHYCAGYLYAVRQGWIANASNPDTIGAKLIGGSYEHGYFFVVDRGSVFVVHNSSKGNV